MTQRDTGFGGSEPGDPIAQAPEDRRAIDDQGGDVEPAIDADVFEPHQHEDDEAGPDADNDGGPVSQVR